MEKLNPNQIAILYLIAFNITESFSLKGREEEALKPIDELLKENGVPSVEKWIPDEDGCPINAGTAVELAWQNTIGKALGEGFEDTGYGRIVDIYMNNPRYWATEHLYDLVTATERIISRRGFQEGDDLGTDLEYEQEEQMGEDAQDVGLIPLYLTQKQLNLIALFVHSSQNRELVEEWVEDENIDAGYEDELAELQKILPDWDQRQDVKIEPNK